MFIRIQGIANEDVVNKIFKTKNNHKSAEPAMSLFCDYSEFEIPIGHVFTFLIDQSENKVYEITGKVMSVTQAWGIPYDVIPIGSKTLCIFRIDEQAKAILRARLPVTDTWVYNSDQLFFSDTVYIAFP